MLCSFFLVVNLLDFLFNLNLFNFFDFFCFLVINEHILCFLWMSWSWYYWSVNLYIFKIFDCYLFYCHWRFSWRFNSAYYFFYLSEFLFSNMDNRSRNNLNMRFCSRFDHLSVDYFNFISFSIDNGGDFSVYLFWRCEDNGSFFDISICNSLNIDRNAWNKFRHLSNNILSDIFDINIFFDDTLIISGKYLMSCFCFNNNFSFYLFFYNLNSLFLYFSVNINNSDRVTYLLYKFNDCSLLMLVDNSYLIIVDKFIWWRFDLLYLTLFKLFLDYMISENYFFNFFFSLYCYLSNLSLEDRFDYRKWSGFDEHYRFHLNINYLDIGSLDNTSEDSLFVFSSLNWDNFDLFDCSSFSFNNFSGSTDINLELLLDFLDNITNLRYNLNNLSRRSRNGDNLSKCIDNLLFKHLFYSLFKSSSWDCFSCFGLFVVYNYILFSTFGCFNYYCIFFDLA